MYKLICMLMLSIVMIGCTNQKLANLENNELQPVNNDMLQKAIKESIKKVDNINRGDYVKK